MPAQKYPPLNLAVIAALYNCSESVAKRMSAAGVDLQNPWEVRKYLQDHGRSQTREAAEKSDVMLALATHTGERSKALIEKSGFYMDAIATQYGVRKERIQEVVAAGVDLRDRRAVRAALATQGTQLASASLRRMDAASGDPELEQAKAKIELMAANAPPAVPARLPPAPSRVLHLKQAPKVKTSEEIASQVAARREYIAGLSPEHRKKMGTEQEIQRWISQP